MALGGLLLTRFVGGGWGVVFKIFVWVNILFTKAVSGFLGKPPPAMNDPMLPLPGLSPVNGKAVVARFDGGLLASDVGILPLREVERRLRVSDWLAAPLGDPRQAA